MTATAERLLEEALGLPPVDRAELIERLFQSFDPVGNKEVDAAWAVEAESRLKAYESGQIAASPAEDVFARLNRK